MAPQRFGQNFGFGFFHVPAAQRMKAISLAGFSDVMLWWGSAYQFTDGSPQELFNLAGREGLSVNTVHFPTYNTPALWQEGEAGERYLEKLILAIRELGQRNIENLVVHTTKTFVTPHPNGIGLERMRQAVEQAEKSNVVIALENTRFLAYNDFLYQQIPSPHLGFCFDSGHAHCFTPDEDPLQRFGHRLATMHLHDNFGPSTGDMHLMMGEGTIDFDDVFRRLKSYAPTSYNLESYSIRDDEMDEMDMDEYLALSYERLAAYF